MKREAFTIDLETVQKKSPDAFYDRVRNNVVELLNFFEKQGTASGTLSSVLAGGLVITPLRNRIHSYHLTEAGQRVAHVGLSKLAQTQGVIGDHIQLHEGAHAFSHQRNLERLALLFSDETTQKVSRSGFHHRIQWASEPAQHYFSGLNEALTDSIPIEIIKSRNWSLIYRHFLYVYPRERNMLATIISSIAQSFGNGPREERESAVFRLLVKSYVLGWEPQLKREFLRVFGPNALRVLAMINAPSYVTGQHGSVTLYPRKWWKMWEKHYYTEALTFFDIVKPEAERDAAARAILPAEGPVHFVERKNSQNGSTQGESESE
jgi:hypothetical protein